MDKLKKYEGFFDFFKRKDRDEFGDKIIKKPYLSPFDKVDDIINDSKDILFELQDLGYKIKIDPKYFKDGGLEVTITRKHPNPEKLNRRVDPTHKELYKSEIKDIYLRLKEYLKSKGFTYSTPQQYRFSSDPLIWGWRFSKTFG